MEQAGHIDHLIGGKVRYPKAKGKGIVVGFHTRNSLSHHVVG